MNYQIADEVQQILTIAIESQLYSASDLYMLALKHQYNWHELVSDICMKSFQQRAKKRAAWYEIIRISQLYWKVEREWF